MLFSTPVGKRTLSRKNQHEIQRPNKQSTILVHQFSFSSVMKFFTMFIVGVGAMGIFVLGFVGY